MDYGHEHVEDLEAEKLRQPPLCLRWEIRGICKELRRILGCSEEEAAIIADIVQNALKGKPETSYSRDRSFYLAADAPSVMHTYRRIVPTVDLMDEKGWIDHDKRAPSIRGCGCGWRSAMAPKRILIDAYQEAVRVRGKPVPLKPIRSVILRNAAGESMPLPRTRKVERMEAEVDAVNAFLGEDDISEFGYMRRIFNVDLDRGGRWYPVGGAWQVMSDTERLEILIRDEPVAEIDIGTMHPAMLYAEVGAKLEGDAYDLVGWPRKLAKMAMLVMINADNMREAAYSLARKAAMAEVAERGSKDAEQKARLLIADVRKRHKAIERAFCSDAGARLMRRDSDIATNVLKAMMKAGEPCLPVHDSFIVRESAADVLEEVMRDAARAAGLPDIELKRTVSANAKVGGEKATESMRLGHNVLTYPSSSLPSSSLFPVESQESNAAVRASAASEPHPEAEDRSSLRISFAAVLNAPAEARTLDSDVDPSEDASNVESPTGSPDVERHDPSSVRSLRSFPWDRSSVLASLELRRHDRAVAAAMAVSGPAADPCIDWSSQIGFGLAQSTHNGATWTWSLPGRRECVVYLWNGAERDAVIPVADQAAAGRVVETYLRTLAGVGRRLRVEVSYAGRYDLGMSFEENAAVHSPVTDTLHRPSMVVGAPDVANDDEPPFQTDLPWYDDEEEMQLAA
ncbi:hypothetical protein [Aureimonas psammosilenae]|uniref:hypothetical protein n=1 Tax=Aureimonas psammosilenae TaxID=2495496 RepID=UPI001260761D|nr:hypothetical protein [Aureimonas psammosilenae]